MKHKATTLLTTITTITGMLTIVHFCSNDSFVSPVFAADLPTSFDLNDTSYDEIRSYYSNLTSLSASEKVGSNLLKNLKPILSNNSVYYDYGTYRAGVGAAYKITDRNWNASPASELTYGTYNPKTNTITGYDLTNTSDSPYVINLYVSRDTSVSGNQITNPITHHTGTSPNFDKEHVFPKSYGFNFSEEPKVRGAAGTDMHHLIAADAYVNQKCHNNFPFGNVSSSSNIGDKESTKTNKLGTSKEGTKGYSPIVSALSETTTVFEPADEWKGDIARALLYMNARYNYLSGSGTPSSSEPNLKLSPYNVYLSGSSIQCDNYGVSEPIEHGNLKCLLEWHHADPVDEYEIHRNNLIYENFQYNRNPFIDYPDWVDYVWNADGTYNTSTSKYAKPATDNIYAYNGSISLDTDNVSIYTNETATVNATASSNVTWTIADSSIASLSWSGTNNKTLLITPTKVGSTTVTASITGGSASLSLTVLDPTVAVTGVTLSSSSLSLEKGKTSTLTATVAPSNATNKNVTWSSSNTSVATVTNGVITGNSVGNATITVKTEDGNKTASCTVSVYEESGDFPYETGIAYHMYLYNTKKSANYFFIGSMNGYYGATSTSESSAVDMYFEKSGDGYNLLFKNGLTDKYITVVQSGTHYNFTISSTMPSDKWYYDTTVATLYRYIGSNRYGLGTSGNYVTFGASNIDTYPNNYYAKFTPSTKASDYAELFLSHITCTGSGSVDFEPSEWESVASSFSELAKTEKDILKTATANIDGTAVEQCVARYDAIVNKYGTKYNDFMSRKASSSNIYKEIDGLNINVNITLILTFASLGAISLLTFILKKKRK